MKRIELLDYGRFLAAISVVGFHWLFNGIHNGKISSITHISGLIDFAKYGYLGVEFFFMISGYVIFFSANNKTPGQFLVSRAIRLYPAFWVAVVFTSIVAQFWGGSTMSVSLPQAIANLTMFPKQLGYQMVDGVYWTLQFEWNFYFAVLMCLMVGLNDKLKVVFLGWPLLMLVASVLGKTTLPYMGGYYSYFAAGALFALYKNTQSKTAIIPILICLYLCVMFSAGKTDELAKDRGIDYSATVIGLVVAFQFAFFVVLNSAWGSRLKLKGAKLAGGLTYPIYLIHAYFGYMFLSRFATEDNKLYVYGIAVVLVLAFAYLIHYFVEQKLADLWRKLFTVSLGVPTDALQSRLAAMLRLGSTPVERTREL